MAEHTTELRLTRPLGPFHLDVALDTDAPRIGLTGPSGSGKSTLLRVLAGVDTRALGTARFGGRVLLDTSSQSFLPAWERRVAWLPQDSLVFPHLNVRENLEYAAKKEADVVPLTRELEIDGLLSRSIARLSGGEAQRVAIGRALLSDPSAFLLDEPFNALDDALKSRVVRVVSQHIGVRPAVIVSHDLTLLRELEAEVWTMDRGQLHRL